MTKALLVLVVSVLGLGSVACAATPEPVTPRMVASGQHLVIEVQGKGSVEVGPGSCNDTPTTTRCEVDWTRVSDPVLVAQAAPGWRFDRWESPSERVSGPSFDDPNARRTYRAVFVEAAPTSARRDEIRSAH
jgi:hypothetical protein